MSTRACLALVATVTLSLLGAGCQTTDSSSTAPASPSAGVASAAHDQLALTGLVTYRERMMLPPGAEIKITLEDVSRMDVAATVLAETTVSTTDKAPPYPFVLSYNPADTDPRHRYTLRARISAENTLLFIGHVPIADPTVAAAEPINLLVTRTATGKPTPSERATSDVSLNDTYWKPLQIEGRPVTLGAGERELHFVLEGESLRVRGFSGCNTFGGSYVREAEALTFGSLISTMKACPTGMEQERRFLQALERTQRFVITGNALSLLDANGTTLIVSEAVQLP